MTRNPTWPGAARRSAARHLALALVAGTIACRPAFEGQEVFPARDLPPFTFTTAQGIPVSTGPSGDRLTVLFFGYTHCPDVCPTTLADWRRVHDRLGSDRARVRFLFVSIDPSRDTPAIVQAYAARYHPSFLGLAGDAVTTGRMMQAYGVAVIPGTSASAPMSGMGHAMPAGAAAGPLGHSSSAFLLNARGQLVAIYPAGSGWSALLADLQALL